MTTKLLGTSLEEITLAAERIRQGEVVGFPTETVYGLGANARDERAVRAIFEAKGRPADNPLIVHISDLSMLREIVTDIPPLAQKLADVFMPGALTMVLPKHESIPLVTSGGLYTVGVRMPKHPVARELIRISGVPIAAPSANRSGSPSPTTAQHVYTDMQGRIPMILDGGSCEGGVESTVICFDDRDTIHVLRPGLVTPEALSRFAPRVLVDKAVYAPVAEGERVASPGMKYKHYAPKARILPIDTDDFASFAKFVKGHANERDYCLVFDDDPSIEGIACLRYGSTGAERAFALFRRFRELDELGAEHVYVRIPPKSGEDLSVYNRLLRASGFEVISL